MIKEPDKAPYIDWFYTTEKPTTWLLERLGVGIVTQSLTERISIVSCDEYEALKPNFFVPEFEDVVFGTAIFLGVGEGGNTVNLTDKQIEVILSYFQW